MFDESPDRGPPVSLRGWLSDIYFPVLVDEDETSVAALLSRLGPKATLDDPIFGRSSGIKALERVLADLSAWLKRHKAAYVKTHFTTGVDRDVTEGSLRLTLESKTVELPVAVVAERRRSREVELRVYYSTQPIAGTQAGRSPLVPEDRAISLPSPVKDHVEALRAADVAGVIATFEADGLMREARGLRHENASGLQEFYAKLFAGAPAGKGVEFLAGGAADDGRTCALEYTLMRLCGKPVPPQAGLAVYERGDGGLLRSVRVYDDLETA